MSNGASRSLSCSGVGNSHFIFIRAILSAVENQENL